MVVAIFEKICGYYAHPFENNHYNEAPKAFLTLLMNSKTIDIQKPNPRRWNTKSYVGPNGSVGTSTSRVVNFEYDLGFRHMIARWKGVFERYTLCNQTLTLSIVW